MIKELKEIMEVLERGKRLYWARHEDGTHMNNNEYQGACLTQYDNAKLAIIKLEGVIARLESPELVSELLLAFSEYHSGNYEEGKKLVQAAINVILDKGEV